MAKLGFSMLHGFGVRMMPYQVGIVRTFRLAALSTKRENNEMHELVFNKEYLEEIPLQLIANNKSIFFAFPSAVLI